MRSMRVLAGWAEVRKMVFGGRVWVIWTVVGGRVNTLLAVIVRVVVLVFVDMDIGCVVKLVTMNGISVWVT